MTDEQKIVPLPTDIEEEDDGVEPYNWTDYIEAAYTAISATDSFKTEEGDEWKGKKIELDRINRIRRRAIRMLDLGLGELYKEMLQEPEFSVPSEIEKKMEEEEEQEGT